MPSHAFDLREPCACGSTAGRIENRNGQNCVFCVKCDDYQYNAPRTEVDRYRQSVVDQLAAFLNARLDEDAQTGRRIKATRHGTLIVAPGDGESPTVVEISGDRLLAEVEAKRRILAEHGPGSDPCDAHDAEFRTIPCTTLLLLALPYANHRDYREEWRP
ncbi:hypothetical protein GCM10017673_40380 [Streptosporangium violaceochromogenes]|nr:hypothetical protein GCM10017673_40380 [Streptosporangium violaceochromogenes]